MNVTARPRIVFAVVLGLFALLFLEEGIALLIASIEALTARLDHGLPVNPVGTTLSLVSRGALALGGLAAAASAVLYFARKPLAQRACLGAGAASVLALLVNAIDAVQASISGRVMSGFFIVGIFVCAVLGALAAGLSFLPAVQRDVVDGGARTGNRADG